MGAMQERMLRGELHRPDDPELLAAQERCAGLLDRYNATRHDEQAEREALLAELLGSVGAGAVVTRDLPAGVVAYGNPARVVREIGERDRVLLP
jgi:maltose O-acetyltransferase